MTREDLSGDSSCQGTRLLLMATLMSLLSSGGAERFGSILVFSFQALCGSMTQAKELHSPLGGKVVSGTASVAALGLRSRSAVSGKVAVLSAVVALPSTAEGREVCAAVVTSSGALPGKVASLAALVAGAAARATSGATEAAASVGVGRAVTGDVAWRNLYQKEHVSMIVARTS